MAKSNEKGLSKGRPHVRIDHSVFYDAAFRALSCNARALFFELVGCYNGRNNGHIYLSVRDAMRLTGMSSDASVTAAFRELRSHGFLALVRAGSFSMKIRHAATWRLTFLPTDNAAATSDYRVWMAPHGSKQAKRLLAVADSRLRSLFSGLTARICKTETPIQQPILKAATLDTGTAKLQSSENIELWSVVDSGTHIVRHLRSRRADRQSCKIVRKQALSWLNEDPSRTQKTMSKLTGIGQSTLSRFLHDEYDRATLRHDQLQALTTLTKVSKLLRSIG